MQLGFSNRAVKLQLIHHHKNEIPTKMHKQHGYGNSDVHATKAKANKHIHANFWKLALGFHMNSMCSSLTNNHENQSAQKSKICISIEPMKQTQA